MVKNSMFRVQKYLERLASAKQYDKECIHSFGDKDGETPLLVSDLKALLQFASANISTTHPSEEVRIAELEAQLSAIGAGGVEPMHNREASAALAVPDERKSFDAANLRDYFGGPLSYRERDIAFMAWKARASLAATPAAALHEEAIAEIVSASHDQAEFGERAINFLRDFHRLESEAAYQGRYQNQANQVVGSIKAE